MTYRTAAAPVQAVAPDGAATDGRMIDVRRGLLVFGKILKFGLFPFAGSLPFPPWRRQSFAVRFRRALEELGLTYLKLGQFLALRFDILPAEVCFELNNLFENVKPMAPGEARRIVERELGAPVETLYAAFGAEPIAAASIGQVHEARLPDGRRVAVKVQRAGIMPVFRADIRNLRKLTALAQAAGAFGRLSVTGMVDEFERWTLREMDFRIEGHTAERVQRNAGPAIVIPAIHWRLTAPRVLTMDFMEGVSATRLPELIATSTPQELQHKLPGFDFDTALHNFTEASLSQLFVDGFFHGDPHPGNILFLSDNRVVFLDFGIFGALTAAQKDVVTWQIESLAVGNIGASLRAYSRQVTATQDTDFDRFRDDCRDVLKRWYGALLDPSLPIEERHLARYTGEMIDVSRRNGLIYDLDYLLFWRALNNLNATLWHIRPDYDLIAQLRAFFEKTRPDAFARVLAMVEDPAWRESFRHLARRLPQDAAAVEQPAMVWTTAAWSDRQARRKALESGGAMLALGAISAAVLAGAGALPEVLRWGLIGLFATTAAAIARRSR